MLNVSLVKVISGISLGFLVALIHFLNIPPEEHYHALYGERGFISSGKYPDLRNITSFKFPVVDGSLEQFEDFKLRVEELHVGKRYRSLDIISPSIGFLSYFAKHRPEEFISIVDRGGISDRTFSHFLKMGYLGDWYEYSTDVDERLLENSEALLAVAADVEDLKPVRRMVADAFFRNQKLVNLELENLAFAIPSMSNAEVSSVIDRLLSSTYKFDPRHVNDLARLELFNQSELLSLIKKTAYKNKSMSSYMTYGALWGEKSYVQEMVLDTLTNAGQPTNFYCAACGLAIVSEGLVASELVEAVESDQLEIRKLTNGQYLLLRQGNSVGSYENE